MKKSILITIIVFTFVALSIFFIGYKSDMLDSVPTPSMYVINVLDKNFYNECHIKGSINVPFMEVEKWANQVDKNAIIVAYCSNYACTASGVVVQQLIKQGFTNVWAYEAGMHDWYKEQFPVVCPIKSSYLTQENKVVEGGEGVPVINSRDLFAMMKKHDFFG